MGNVFINFIKAAIHAFLLWPTIKKPKRVTHILKKSLIFNSLLFLNLHVFYKCLIVFGNKIQVVVFSYKKNSRQTKNNQAKEWKKSKTLFLYIRDKNTVLMDTKKNENFTNKKGSHKFVFMLVSTAEISAKKGVLYMTVHITLQFLVQEFFIQFDSSLTGRVNPLRFCLPSPTPPHWISNDLPR